MTTSVGRLVTRLDPGGHAAVHSAGELSITKWRGADAGDAVVWSTATVPADNSDAELDTAGKDIGTTINGGTVFRVTELGPGFRSPMHRTLSCDCLIVLTGELEIILDSGEALDLGPGDTVIQRGTAHAWRNPSQQQRCTFAVAMIEANPVRVGSRTFGATPTWRMLASALRTMLPRGLGGPRVAGRTADLSSRVPRRIVTGYDAEGKARSFDPQGRSPRASRTRVSRRRPSGPPPASRSTTPVMSPKSRPVPHKRSAGRTSASSSLRQASPRQPGSPTLLTTASSFPAPWS